MCVSMVVQDSIFLWEIMLILILQTFIIKFSKLIFQIHSAFIKIHNLFCKIQIIQKILIKNNLSKFLSLLEYYIFTIILEIIQFISKL